MANVDQNESQPLNVLKVYMKCSEKFFTFDKKTYPPILREYIPKKDWEQIALEATRVIGTAWLKKKNHEKVQIPKWMYMTSIITIILLLFYFITLYIFGNSSNENTFLLTISMTAIIAGLILSFCLAIYNFLTVIFRNFLTVIPDLSRAFHRHWKSHGQPHQHVFAPVGNSSIGK